MNRLLTSAPNSPIPATTLLRSETKKSSTPLNSSFSRPNGPDTRRRTVSASPRSASPTCGKFLASTDSVPPISPAATTSAPKGVAARAATRPTREITSIAPFAATTAANPLATPPRNVRSTPRAGPTSPLTKSARPCSVDCAPETAIFRGSEIEPMSEAPKSANDSSRFATRPPRVSARSWLAPTRRSSCCSPVIRPVTNRSEVISPASCISTSWATLPPVSWSARILRMLRPGRFSASWLSSSPCRRPAETTWPMAR